MKLQLKLTILIFAIALIFANRLAQNSLIGGRDEFYGQLLSNLVSGDLSDEEQKLLIHAITEPKIDEVRKILLNALENFGTGVNLALTFTDSSRSTTRPLVIVLKAYTNEEVTYNTSKGNDILYLIDPNSVGKFTEIELEGRNLEGVSLIVVSMSPANAEELRSFLPSNAYADNSAEQANCYRNINIGQKDTYEDITISISDGFENSYAIYINVVGTELGDWKITLRDKSFQEYAVSIEDLAGIYQACFSEQSMLNQALLERISK